MMAAEIDVRGAFLAALLLTGKPETAEAAVSDAIASSECEVNELPVATAKCAIQLRDECLPRPEIPSTLPPELQRLFLLSSLGRKCFVLRIPMGFTREMSTELLNVTRDEFDETAVAGAIFRTVAATGGHSGRLASVTGAPVATGFSHTNGTRGVRPPGVMFRRTFA